MYRSTLNESCSTYSTASHLLREENDNLVPGKPPFFQFHPHGMLWKLNLTNRFEMFWWGESRRKPWRIHTIWWTICSCALLVSEMNIIYMTSRNNYLILAPDKVQIFCNNKSYMITDTVWIIGTYWLYVMVFWNGVNDFIASWDIAKNVRIISILIYKKQLKIKRITSVSIVDRYQPAAFVFFLVNKCSSAWFIYNDKLV